MKTQFFSFFICVLFLGSACRESTTEPLAEFQIQTSYNTTQLNLIEYLETGNQLQARLSRMLPVQRKSLEDALAVYSPEFTWQVFDRIEGEMEEMIRSAELRELYILSGSGKVMKAFLYFSMMDLFGEGAVGPVDGMQEVPNVANPFPAETNYQRTLVLLNQAIEDLGKGGKLPDVDLFYQGDAMRWIRLAKTLQLRAYNNIRLVNPDAKEKINELISEGDLMEEMTDDFQFQYGSGLTRVENSNLFVQTYQNPFPSIYSPPPLSNYFMWLLVGEKTIPDPRTRYYFYRQVADFSRFPAYCGTEPMDPTSLPTAPSHYLDIDANMPYCFAAENGYFGKDHGDPILDAPDQAARTAIGLYPFGGKFDDNSFDGDLHGDRVFADGKGIFPILLASYVSFIRAEAALTLGTNDNAAQMLEKGIRQSFAKVKSSEQYLNPVCPVASCTVVDDLMQEASEQLEDYVSFVLSEFNASSDPEKKLDIIMKEYLIALWGNGWEAYNNYRRTAMPSHIQPALFPSKLPFIRSIPPAFRAYSSQGAIKNEPVFWDINDASKFR